jgi:hypothetical protein
MERSQSSQYEAPEVTEYGSVESLTLEDKCGTSTDQYSNGTPLSGSIYDDNTC